MHDPWQLSLLCVPWLTSPRGLMSRMGLQQGESPSPHGWARALQTRVGKRETVLGTFLDEHSIHKERGCKHSSASPRAGSVLLPRAAELREEAFEKPLRINIFTD